MHGFTFQQFIFVEDLFLSKSGYFIVVWNWMLINIIAKGTIFNVFIMLLDSPKDQL